MNAPIKCIKRFTIFIAHNQDRESRPMLDKSPANLFEYEVEMHLKALLPKDVVFYSRQKELLDDFLKYSGSEGEFYRVKGETYSAIVVLSRITWESS